MARTSTFALTNATIPYALKLADKGWKQACKENHDLLEGLNIVDGKVVYKGVADAWGLPYTPVEECAAGVNLLTQNGLLRSAAKGMSLCRPAKLPYNQLNLSKKVTFS